MPVPQVSVVDQVAAALSSASLRHQVISSNIANRETPDYQRLKVGFDRALGDAALPSSAGRVGARAVVVADEVAAKPALEQDMVDLASNTMNYQALAKTLSRYFAILATIANGGRS